MSAQTETIRKAREKALHLLRYRERSVQEIKTSLRGSGFSENVVEEVVQQLSRIGLLDDERFSREWVRSRLAGMPMGRARLASELSAKGVQKRTIDAALKDIDDEVEYQAARQLIERKLREKSTRNEPTMRRRLAMFLGRRGFDWETIDRVLNEGRTQEQKQFPNVS